MDVRMIVEALIPRMEHREDANEQPLPGGHVEDGLGGCGKEGVERVDPALPQEEGSQGRGYGEDEMESS
jgi:hypothetical protein